MKQPTKSLIVKLTTFISLPIIGVLCTLLVQQLFFKPNKKEEEIIKIQAEIIKKEYETFNRIEQFTKLAQQVGTYVFQPIAFIDASSKNIIGKDNKGETYILPTIVMDSIKRKKFRELYISIYENRDGLPSEIFEAVDDLNQFFLENPLPAGNTFRRVELSSWSSKEILGRWLTLADKIELRLIKYRRME